MIRDGWRREAACRHADTQFPHPSDHNGIWRARRVCRPCPVRDQCLNLGRATIPSDGIWGGHTPEELRRLNAGQPAQHCTTCRLLHVPRQPGADRCTRCALKHRHGSAAERARKVVDDNRDTVLALHRSGHGPTLIGRALGVSRDAVRNGLKRWQKQAGDDLAGVR